KLIALAATTLVFSLLAMLISITLYWLSAELTRMPLAVLAVPMIALFAQVFTKAIDSLKSDAAAALAKLWPPKA
ncbi:MAG: hypothetical protein ACRCUI_09015, partial [Polymorphobacter sp.]